MKAANWLYFALTEATKRFFWDLDNEEVSEVGVGTGVGTEVKCTSSVDANDSTSTDCPPVGVS